MPIQSINFKVLQQPPKPLSVPVFATQPSAPTVASGATAQFASTAIGFQSPDYQWQIKGGP